MGGGSPTERRRHPRYAYRLAVRVAGMAAHTTNISLGGMQVECPMLQAELLRRQLDARRLPLQVPVADGVPLAVDTEVRYLSEYGQDLLIGLLIEGFPEGGGEAYARLVAEISTRARTV
jgi:hypothetical protein